MIWNKNIDQIQTNLFTYYYYHEDEKIHLDIKTLDEHKDESYLGMICESQDDDWEAKIENFIREYEADERNAKIAKSLNTETRIAKISINKKGGTASREAVGYRLILPNAWMNKLGITEESREVILSFDGEKITIEKDH
ncbi:hypothetical protein KQI41_01290 [Tissierella pigra]|uniref:hypothetical protein n=1 Tax=Tissierella pigra TaxID=2607614 RepID=UPI001C1004CA|nr:hypothetical protein [Tissierella pigra]MBU5425030.1 hypothetical protein [Tissierella pigra]